MRMSTIDNLSNHFLIAMPALDDPNFLRSVVLICGHNADGAMGVIINHPLNMNMGKVYQQLNMDCTDDERNQQVVINGGPILPEQGFVIHEAASTGWKGTLPLSDELAITTSSDILSALSQGQGPKQSLVALGYAGWDTGQLEQEIADNAWLCVPAKPEIVFDCPMPIRWSSAAKTIGVNLLQLSDDVGHA